MIIKFLSRKANSGQLVQYILRYILSENKSAKNHDGKNNVINTKDTFLIKHNIRSRTVKGFLKEFNENESYRLVRRKDSVKAFHTIISFGKNDKHLISDKLLKDIGKQFIQERGLNNLYVGTKHEDKDHTHLHICSSGTQLNGRSARISKQKFRSIILSLDRYQRAKYPFLIHSLPDHQKAKQATKDALVSTIKAKRQFNKAALLESLEKVYDQSNSKAEFLSQIKAQGHELYLRGGKLQGLLFEGKVKYRFSRLGFDHDRFEALDSIKRPLQDLHNLRVNRPKVKTLEKQPKDEIEATSTINKDNLIKLDEISSIRKKAQDKEKDVDFERSRDVSEDRNDTSTNNFDADSPLFPGLLPKLIPLPLTEKV